ncbi:MAG: WD40 repeat domain-containing serine/threonine-protein kinase [bacterium]|nr:WD40 repeat domain-containing serine/threonine-protein kinase [bacterium]
MRCFLNDFPDHQSRYNEISKHLRVSGIPYKVDFVFQQQGIRVHGKWYPIVKMEWVEGKPLNAHIEAFLGDPVGLRRLSENWLELLRNLAAARVAHGDLQHGNVLVANGALRLIDYDGMFVPSLGGLPSHECGHPCYQHPNRRTGDFGLEIDRFSALAIYVAIRALIECPSLWPQFDNGDNILFRRDDFVNPSRSAVFTALRQLTDAGTVKLAMALWAACSGPVDRVPTIDNASLAVDLPLWVADRIFAARPAEQRAPRHVSAFVFDFTELWRRPGPRSEMRIRQEPVYEERTREVTREETFERRWVGWGLYIAIQAVALAIKPELLILTLWLATAVLGVGRGQRTVPYKETYKHQVGTKPVEEWVTNHVPGHRSRVTSVCFSSDGAILYSAGRDGHIYIWDRNTGERKAGFMAPVVTSMMARGARDLVASCCNRNVCLWDSTGHCGGRYPVKVKSVLHSAATTSDGRLIAAGTGIGRIYVWDMKVPNAVRVLAGPRRVVVCLAFHPDGRHLIAGSSDMAVRVWDVHGEKCVAVLHRHTGKVNCVSLSPTGDMVASGASDGAILLWDWKTRQPILRVAAKCTEVLSVQFTPDGEYVISGGSDGVIRCWNVRSGQESGQFRAHSGPVRGVSLTGDGAYFASCGGEDCTVRVWKRHQ